MTDDDAKQSYKRGRAALRELHKTRDFFHWLEYVGALDTAQREAMRKAGTNQPRQGLQCRVRECRKA